MIGRVLTTVCVAGALALTPAERAEADAGEFIGGALIGGIIGYAAGQNQGQRTRTTTTRVVRPGIPSTQQGRETQTALNYFGYDAGTVDGQIGPGTRAAIERFQASMGYPVNGREFASYQFDFLMDGYFWATQQGGAQQTGLRGPQLLYAYRDSLSGASIQSSAPATTVQPPATTVIVNPQGPYPRPRSRRRRRPRTGSCRTSSPTASRACRWPMRATR
jgi:peptidoglycan hydrolase-like protein with peptidoglycan-binding domain